MGYQRLLHSLLFISSKFTLIKNRVKGNKNISANYSHSLKKILVLSMVLRVFCAGIRAQQGISAS